MAVHAAMVDRLDQGVGQLVAGLAAAGQLENTLLIFLADNGASPEIPGQPGYDRTATTRDGRAMKYDRDGLQPAEIGNETAYTGIGQRWASACNTPFRFWKKESFEGGAHTPCILHWPQRLQRPGRSMPAVGHVMDIVPTLLDVAETEYPAELAGHALSTLDGRSLAPLIAGDDLPPRGAHFFEHEGGRAVRDGEWKMVAASRRPQQWQLYNLATDRTETRDLAANEPQRVKSLADQWHAWARAVGVPPPARPGGTR
jgi:arylsulfatase